MWGVVEAMRRLQLIMQVGLQVGGGVGSVAGVGGGGALLWH